MIEKESQEPTQKKLTANKEILIAGVVAMVAAALIGRQVLKGKKDIPIEDLKDTIRNEVVPMVEALRDPDVAYFNHPKTKNNLGLKRRFLERVFDRFLGPKR